MKKIEEMLKKADFSKETALKVKLKQKLFEDEKKNVKSMPLSDDDLSDVAAAGDLYLKEDEKNDLN